MVVVAVLAGAAVSEDSTSSVVAVTGVVNSAVLEESEPEHDATSNVSGARGSQVAAWLVKREQVGPVVSCPPSGRCDHGAIRRPLTRLTARGTASRRRDGTVP